MSVQDVLARWGTYRSVPGVMYLSINDSPELADMIANIGPFPVKDPGQWGVWLNASAFLDSLQDAVQVTDAALRQENSFIAATNGIAATVRLPAPTAVQVRNVVNQLDVVNKRIQQDQRFATALAIGVTLAGQVDTQLRK
jgi:hypothetical protein